MDRRLDESSRLGTDLHASAQIQPPCRGVGALVTTEAAVVTDEFDAGGTLAARHAPVTLKYRA
jgi:hypothetical protein